MDKDEIGKAVELAHRIIKLQSLVALKMDKSVLDEEIYLSKALLAQTERVRVLEESLSKSMAGSLHVEEKVRDLESKLVEAKEALKLCVKHSDGFKPNGERRLGIGLEREKQSSMDYVFVINKAREALEKIEGEK